MANRIKLKRGLSTNVGSLQLETGEVAVTTDTGELYVGDKDKKVMKINNNTTYTLTKNGPMITLTGSDGSTSNLLSEVFVGDTEPTDENIYFWVDTTSARVINFIVYGTTYQAEEGMIWTEWIESKYNPFENDEVFDGGYLYWDYNWIQLDNCGSPTMASDTIKENGVYGSIPYPD